MSRYQPIEAGGSLQNYAIELEKAYFTGEPLTPPPADTQNPLYDYLTAKNEQVFVDLILLNPEHNTVYPEACRPPLHFVQGLTAENYSNLDCIQDKRRRKAKVVVLCRR